MRTDYLSLQSALSPQMWGLLFASQPQLSCGYKTVMNFLCVQIFIVSVGAIFFFLSTSPKKQLKVPRALVFSINHYTKASFTISFGLRTLLHKIY